MSCPFFVTTDILKIRHHFQDAHLDPEGVGAPSANNHITSFQKIHTFLRIYFVFHRFAQIGNKKTGLFSSH